jgi:uncharacterized membrane protein
MLVSLGLFILILSSILLFYPSPDLSAEQVTTTGQVESYLNKIFARLCNLSF